MGMTTTELRKNIYNVLDKVLETGVPQEVVRRGRTLLITPAEPKRRRLGDLPRRQILNCSFDDLVATTWEWEPAP
jgi:prevent-host-death family protein